MSDYTVRHEYVTLNNGVAKTRIVRMNVFAPKASVRERYTIDLFSPPVETRLV